MLLCVVCISIAGCECGLAALCWGKGALFVVALVLVCLEVG